MFDIEKFISSLNTKYLQHECCMGYSGKLESKARVLKFHICYDINGNVANVLVELSNLVIY